MFGRRVGRMQRTGTPPSPNREQGEAGARLTLPDVPPTLGKRTAVVRGRDGSCWSYTIPGTHHTFLGSLYTENIPHVAQPEPPMQWTGARTFLDRDGLEVSVETPATDVETARGT